MGTGVAPDGTGEGVQGLGRFLENHPLAASGRGRGRAASESALLPAPQSSWPLSLRPPLSPTPYTSSRKPRFSPGVLTSSQILPLPRASRGSLSAVPGPRSPPSGLQGPGTLGPLEP